MNVGLRAGVPINVDGTAMLAPGGVGTRQPTTMRSETKLGVFETMWRNFLEISHDDPELLAEERRAMGRLFAMHV